MPTYSAYVIGPDTRISGVEGIEARDDQEAIRMVQERFPAELIELWLERRLICQIDHGVVLHD